MILKNQKLKNTARATLAVLAVQTLAPLFTPEAHAQNFLSGLFSSSSQNSPSTGSSGSGAGATGSSGGSGPTADGDACADAGGDQAASQNCKMHKVAVVTAAAQAVETAAFTAAGVTGILACNAQKTSKDKDTEACNKADSNKTKADQTQTSQNTTKTSAETAGTQTNAVEGLVNTVKTQVDEYAGAKINTAEGAVNGASQALARVASCTPSGQGAFNSFRSQWSSYRSSAANNLKTKSDDLSAQMQTVTQSKSTLTEKVNTANTDATDFVTKAEDAQTKCNQAKGSIAAGHRNDETAAQEALTAANDKARQGGSQLSGGPQPVASRNTQHNANVDAANAAAGSAKNLSTHASDQDQSAQTFVTDTETLSSQKLTELNAAATSTQTSTGELLTSINAVVSALSSDSGACNPQTQGPCCAQIGAATTAVGAVTTQVGTLQAAVSGIIAAGGAVTAPANTLKTNAETVKTNSSQVAQKATENIEATTEYVTLATAAMTLRQDRELKANVYNVTEWAAYGSDLAGAGAIVAAQVAISGRVEASGITSIVSTVGADALALGMRGSQNSNPDDLSCSGIMQCWTMDFMQAGLRGLNMGMSIKAAVDASRYQRSMAGNQAVMAPTRTLSSHVSGSGASSSENQATAATGSDPGIARDLPPSERAHFTPQAVASSLATAQERNVIPKALEQVGGPTPEALAQHLMNGETPMVAAAATLGSNLGESASALSAFEQNKDKMMDIAKSELEKISPTSSKAIEFASTSGGKPKHSNHDDGMPDLNALMAQFLKKPEAPKSQAAARSVAGAPAPATLARTDGDGLHPKDRSLFEIVDTRYQLVQKRFLDGQSVGTGAGMPSILPKNPYLKP